ncbi:S24 family peptidase [Neptuniibacter sp. QD48_55]|uniref:S24 family peptidase n=1 Tax=Neptuniibacter sp. QD48_55 TaxID=3398212 RepID=UPI0039F52BF1
MLRYIPIYSSAGISGFESPAAEYTELALSLDQLLIDHPHATYLGFVEGGSMRGVGIFPNDLLVVSRAETVKEGDVIVATLNGNFFLLLPAINPTNYANRMNFLSRVWLHVLFDYFDR